MSGFSIRVRIDDREVTGGLEALRRNIADLTPAMKGIGQTIVTDADLCFRQESDPWGQQWKALAASTIRRRRKGPSSGRDKILRDTGRLSKSINYRATSKSVTVGTNVIYSAIHQYGGKAGRNRRVTIPRRAFLPIGANGEADLPRDTIDEIIDVLRLHLIGGIRR
jgi:phage virion morphogenesis protein